MAPVVIPTGLHTVLKLGKVTVLRVLNEITKFWDQIFSPQFSIEDG